MSVSPVTQIYGTITFLNYIGNDFYISSEKFLGSSSTKIVIEMLVIIFFSRSDRVLDELWMENQDIVQETDIKKIPKEKTNAKSKMVV